MKKLARPIIEIKSNDVLTEFETNFWDIIYRIIKTIEEHFGIKKANEFQKTFYAGKFTKLQEKIDFCGQYIQFEIKKSLKY